MSKDIAVPSTVLIEIIRMQLKICEAISANNGRLAKLELTAETLLQGEYLEEFRKHFTQDQKNAENLQSELKVQVQQTLNALEEYMNG